MLFRINSASCNCVSCFLHTQRISSSLTLSKIQHTLIFTLSVSMWQNRQHVYVLSVYRATPVVCKSIPVTITEKWHQSSIPNDIIKSVSDLYRA